MKKVLAKQMLLYHESEIKDDFVFLNPLKIEIKSSVDGEKNYCQLGDDKWVWTFGGVLFNIKWADFLFSENLKNILKAFIVTRFPRVSPGTITSTDVRFLKFLNTTKYGTEFPWEDESQIQIMLVDMLKYSLNGLYGFKAFYRFGTDNHISGFNSEMLSVIEDFKNPNPNQQYGKVLLNEINKISPEDENLIIDTLNQPKNILDYIEFRNDVIFHLALELAPRPIQIHSLSIEDADAIMSSSGSEMYYSIWLPMAKKRNKFSMEKRARQITKSLGIKLSILIEENKRLNPCPTPLSPIFMNPEKLLKNNGLRTRLDTVEISKIITAKMKSFGFGKGDGAVFLRHHLAQSLADQGASAETIAEILGHNSTVPARAYIAATPTIAEIKTRALGKNDTFQIIMKMLLTGEVIKKEDAKNERWVKGMVGSRYIGGIGACGLNANTECPKNPVYSCYTCKKFNPFKDGVHSEVKEMLQKEAQYFIDISERGLALESNRTITQLERTIEAVDAVIERISIQD